jgi:AcrR family transcriptional regulator
MKRYHHPDLRAALMEAALSELTEKGPRRFSLRQVAARAGVSHTAPYRHFKDKDALLSALVREGLASLTKSLKEANRIPADTARERLGRLGRAYVSFGRQNPKLLTLIFSDLGFGALGAVPPDITNKSDYDAFGELEATVKACQLEGSLDPELDSGVLSLLVWSTVHGLAILFIENVLPAMTAKRGLSPDVAEADILRALGEFFYPKGRT